MKDKHKISFEDIYSEIKDSPNKDLRGINKRIHVKREIGYVKPIHIKHQRHKLKRPLNLRKKEVEEITLRRIILIILNFFKKISVFFANDLPSNLKKLYYGILGTMVGFSFAIILFPENPGIFAVFFTSIFLAPFILKEIKYNELMVGRTEEVKKKGVSLVKFKVKSRSKFSFSEFYRENKNILNTYFFFFLGVMLVVIFLIALIPKDYSSELFSSQGWENKLLPTRSIGFENTPKLPLFKSIITNNLSVLIACFIIALVFPLGATMLIVWNAIYWGVVFTQYALTYSAAYNFSFLLILIPLLLSISLHTILEIMSYFLATMSGNLLAIGISKERKDENRLFLIINYCIILLLCSLLFLVIGGFAEVYIFDFLKNIFFSIF